MVGTPPDDQLVKQMARRVMQAHDPSLQTLERTLKACEVHGVDMPELARRVERMRQREQERSS